MFSVINKFFILLFENLKELNGVQCVLVLAIFVICCKCYIVIKGWKYINKNADNEKLLLQTKIRLRELDIEKKRIESEERIKIKELEMQEKHLND